MLLRKFFKNSVKLCGQDVRWCRICTLPFSTSGPPAAGTDAIVPPASTGSVLSREILATPPSDLTRNKMPYLDPAMTSEHNPSNHTTDHLGLWYTIPAEEFKALYSAVASVPLSYKQLTNTFKESSLMIRRPAVSVISYIKQLQLNTLTPPKFMFHGARGAGKSCSIAHVVHFLHKEDFVLLMVPWADRWLKQFLKKPHEVLPSVADSQRWDHTTDSSDWLQFFRDQNIDILTKQQLTISKEYQFSSREKCNEGSDILGVVDLGISRPKLASDCVVALTSELKILATAGRCKLAVVMDGINSMFTEKSIYKRDDFDFYTRAQFSYIPAQSFTLVQAFTNMLNNDWTNGVIVGSVDYCARKDKDRKSHLPRYILGEEGWNKLDPFVPIPVPEYSDVEFESAIAYFASKYWIQKPNALTKEGKTELAALTGKNGQVLVELLSSL